MIHKVTSDSDRKHVVPDPLMDLGPVERVDVTADYRAELSVPLTSAQLAAIERIAQAQRISPADAVQRLVEQALALRAHR